MLTWTLHVSGATAGQLVEFDASSGTTSTRLLGYLARPDGVGPFPAVVILHGCGGLLPSNTLMAERLRRWGYVALAIDSLGPRGRSNACTTGSRDQSLDAYSGLRFLAAQDFVDPDRIGLLGYSMGGGAALIAGERGRIEQLFPQRFRAVIAYYPARCGRETRIMVAPTLILIGALDDWESAQECTDMVKLSSDKGAAIDIVVYPNAYHDFDIAELVPGRRYLGHWLEYNEPAAKDALTQIRRFLGRTLGGYCDNQVC